MLIQRSVPKRQLKDYRKFLSPSEYKRIVNLSRTFKGKRIIHVNATPDGGGVAEILTSLVPLQRSLGIDARWYYIKAPNRFYGITKKIHDSLQGSTDTLTKREKEYYLDVNEVLAEDAAMLKPDVFVVHDPQPLGAVDCCSVIPTVLRVHIDLSHPNPDTLKFLLPYVKKYNTVVYSMDAYVPRRLGRQKVFIVSPAIDPLNAKHRPVSARQINRVLRVFALIPICFARFLWVNTSTMRSAAS